MVRQECPTYCLVWVGLAFLPVWQSLSARCPWALRVGDGLPEWLYGVEKLLAVVGEASFADAGDLEHFCFVGWEFADHFVETAVGEDDVGWDAMFLCQLFAQGSELLGKILFIVVGTLGCAALCRFWWEFLSFEDGHFSFTKEDVIGFGAEPQYGEAAFGLLEKALGEEAVDDHAPVVFVSVFAYPEGLDFVVVEILYAIGVLAHDDGCNVAGTVAFAGAGDGGHDDLGVACGVDTLHLA